MAFAYEHAPRGSSPLEVYWNESGRKVAVLNVLGFRSETAAEGAAGAGATLVQTQPADPREGHRFLQALASPASAADLGKLLNLAMGLIGFREFRLAFVGAPTAISHAYEANCTVISSVAQGEFRAQGPQAALRRIPGYGRPTGVPQLWCNLRELDVEPEVVRTVFPLPERVCGITLVTQGRGQERLYLCVAGNPGGVAPVDFLAPRIASLTLLAAMCNAGMRVLAGRSGRVGPLQDLTKREFQCLYWAAAGKTALETSGILDIAMRTANFHLQNAIEKLGAANKYQAIVIATRLGLLDEEYDGPGEGDE